jgi:diadenosine tetraphosphate (Ap4A) HIT family hydrolase
MTDCVFCPPPADRIIIDRPLAVAIRDAYPVSPGHALLVPKRHVYGWSDAMRDEKIALLDLLDAVRHVIDAEHEPDGYNVGFNDGTAAGQTVFHLHIHVIPRYRGDTPDARGGIRHVVPEKARYWK